MDAPDHPAGGLRGPVLAGVVGKVAEAVTLVLLATVVPRWLGPADYGRFAVALTVVAIGSVAMTLGGATLLARYVPAAAPGDRAAVARSLSLRLARNRAALFVPLAVAGAALAAWDPARFPPLATAFVLLALALNVAATLALQADLGLGRAGAWCARYPVQNAVLIVAALAGYELAGMTGALAAILGSAVVAFGIGAGAVVPLLGRRLPAASLPDGALRFGFVAATSGALVQIAQRGGVIAVALLAGSGLQTGYAALAVGVALAATYAIVQVFTVSLPRLAEHHGTGHHGTGHHGTGHHGTGHHGTGHHGTGHHGTGHHGTGPAGTHLGSDAEPVLRRMAGLLLAVVLPGAAAVVLVLDTVVPIAFGRDYAGAAEAFGPAVAMVVLAPLNALAVQAAALRLRPATTLWGALAGAVAFTGVALTAVPAWGAAGATAAALAGAAASAVVAARLLPGAVGTRLAVASLGGASAVAVLGVLT